MEELSVEAARGAGENVYRVGAWSSLTHEEMTVWLVGFTISHPSAYHSERMGFAWGFLAAYRKHQAQQNVSGGKHEQL